jgi:hypothetical protein
MLKKNFFVLFPSPLPRWVGLVQKTRAKNSHAWAPWAPLNVKAYLRQPAMQIMQWIAKAGGLLKLRLWKCAFFSFNHIYR